MAGEQDNGTLEQSGAAPGGGEPVVTPTPQAAAAAAGLPYEVLPENLRNALVGKTAMEQKTILTGVLSALQRANSENEQLRLQVANAVRPPEPQAPVKPLEERIYEDPEGVIKEVIERHYGSQFSTVSSMAGEGVYGSLALQYPEVVEKRESINELLQASGAPPTRDNILGAYQMVLGRETLENRRTAAAHALNPEIPQGGPQAPAAPQLSSLEDEIRRGMGMSAEDYIKYRGDYFEVKVPV
jgi:hypothetical protein